MGASTPKSAHSHCAVPALRTDSQALCLRPDALHGVSPSTVPRCRYTLLLYNGPTRFALQIPGRSMLIPELKKTMNTTRRAARRERNFSWLLEITLLNLSNCYMHIKPGAQEKEFLYEFVKNVAGMDDSSIEEPIGIAMSCLSAENRAKGPDWIARSPYCSVIVATAYWSRAARAMQAGDMDLAWSFMADARYYTGVAISSKGIDLAREDTIAAVKRSKGVDGAEGRNRAFEPIRQFAYKMAKKKLPPQKGWQSGSHAVQTIKGVVLRFAKRQRVTMSEEQAEKTIAGWLKKMPEAEALFPKKKSGLKKARVGTSPSQ